MNDLEKSLAWTKEHYPDIKIIEVNEFTDLCTSTPEQKSKAISALVAHLFEKSLNGLWAKEDKDWLSIQSHVETIVKVKG